MGIVEEVGPEVEKVKKGNRVVCLLIILADTVIIVKMIWKANVTIPIRIHTSTLVGILVSLNDMEVTKADKLNYCVYLSEILFRCYLRICRINVLPTAYWSVESGGVKKGDTVVVLGCGPIGLMTQKFAWMKGAKRVIAVDNLSYRLNHAKKMNNVEIINFDEHDDTGAYIAELTKGTQKFSVYLFQ